MNRFKISALLVALLFSLPMLAQNKLYFCDDVTEAGEPIGHATEWSISPTEGGYIYGLYTNNKKPIKDAQLGIKLERKNDMGAYELFDELTVETEAGKTWIFFELQFTEEGDYRVTMMDASGKNLAIENLTLAYSAESEVIEDISDEHAKGYKLVLTDKLDAENMPVGAKKEFKLVNGKTTVVIHLMHKDGLKANRFTITPVKDGAKDMDAGFDIEVGADWVFCFYEYEITQPGNYTITVTSPSGKQLAVGTVKVIK